MFAHMELGFYVCYVNVLFHFGVVFEICMTLWGDEVFQWTGVNSYQVGDLLYACGELDRDFV